MRIHDLRTRHIGEPSQRKILHLHQYAIDMAYVATRDMTETRKVFKKRVYDIMSYIDNARHNPLAIRIAQNLPTLPGSAYGETSTEQRFQTLKSTCYAAIHDIVECKRNVMAHAQKPDSVFQRNGRVHLYRRGCHFSRVLAFLECGSAENDYSNTGRTVPSQTEACLATHSIRFFPLHFSSRASPCATRFRFHSTYQRPSDRHSSIRH